MYEDKYGARLDQMQVMINEMRKDLDGFKKDQIERFDAKLSVLEKSVAIFQARQNNLSAKFWTSFIVNLLLVFVLAVFFGLSR